MKKIERLQKYAEGGKVRKFDGGGNMLFYRPSLNPQNPNYAQKYGIETPGLTRPSALDQLLPGTSIEQQVAQTTEQYSVENLHNSIGEIRREGGTNTPLSDSQLTVPEQQVAQTEQPKQKTGKMGGGFTKGDYAVLGELAVDSLKAVDNAIMGDKNFSASSQAIDTAVHGTSSALMKSGNPWLMGAAAALEGLNFVTKAGGKNVPGYDVNIQNSGYGNLGHQDSEAGRIWDNWSGATAKKLAKRNEQARMALAAMDISEDQAFEQEARSNSVTNVLQQNQIALAGGIDTSLLGS